MKKLVLCFAILLGLQPISAQFVQTLPISASDLLSQGTYTKINGSNLKSTSSSIVNTAHVATLAKVINHQNIELTNISLPLIARQIGLNKFVSGASFSNAGGYDSYGYIQEKYPIINLFNPTDLVRNKIIRLRFQNKLRNETSNINNYLNPINPISEGERILLVLASLENVINIVLENEEF
jgi:hypothetical protein